MIFRTHSDRTASWGPFCCVTPTVLCQLPLRVLEWATAESEEVLFGQLWPAMSAKVAARAQSSRPPSATASLRFPSGKVSRMHVPVPQGEPWPWSCPSASYEKHLMDSAFLSTSTSESSLTWHSLSILSWWSDRLAFVQGMFSLPQLNYGLDNVLIHLKKKSEWWSRWRVRGLTTWSTLWKGY